MTGSTVTKVKLRAPSYNEPKAKRLAYIANMKELVEQYKKGERIYVEFDSAYDKKRIGSIGYIKKADTHIGEIRDSRFGYGYGSGPPVDASMCYESFGWMSIRWDGRSNVVNTYDTKLIWLKGYTGPSVWVYDKEANLPPPMETKDRLGNPIKVGDFICYILYHFGNHQGASTQFGAVSRITKGGEIYARNIKLNDKDTESSEKKIKDNSQIVVMTKDLMDRLMLAKLANP